MLAFLHLPPESARRTTAVLLCAPFGWADTCAHRGLRAWAIALAQAGYPALRFDLPSPSADKPGLFERSWSGFRAWFGRGEQNEAQIREFVVQFSVFSNQFLIAQLNKVINADTLDGMRASKEILANELGVTFRKSGDSRSRAPCVSPG